MAFDIDKSFNIFVGEIVTLEGIDKEIRKGIIAIINSHKTQNLKRKQNATKYINSISMQFETGDDRRAAIASDYKLIDKKTRKDLKKDILNLLRKTNPKIKDQISSLLNRYF